MHLRYPLLRFRQSFANDDHAFFESWLYRERGYRKCAAIERQKRETVKVEGGQLWSKILRGMHLIGLCGLNL